MQSYTRGKIGIISCDGGMPFAEKVTSHLENLIKQKDKRSKKLRIHTIEPWFSSGEVKTEIGQNTRNRDVYIIQDVNNTTVKKNDRLLSVNDHYMALKTAIESARRADVHYITAILPCFPYSRQDKKKTREGITAQMVARELELAGANRVITLDIHNASIEGFFQEANFENLWASKCFIPYIKKNFNRENLMSLAPDVGSVGRNEYYAKNLGIDLGIVYKRRDYSKPNTVDEITLLGDVKGKDILICDDIIDTAGTVIKVAELIKKEGAKNIYLFASLPVFSGPAIERLSEAYKEELITRVITTDAIYHGNAVKETMWYEEVSVASLFAKAIYNINKGASIRDLLQL